MEVSKYLTLARQARAEGNTEDAKNYYNKVREEKPEDGEAKFFYAFYAMHEGTNGELPQRFKNLCQTAVAVVKMVKNSDLSEADQIATLAEIVSAFTPEPWAENRYMNKKNHETKVGDSYVTVFDFTQITSCCKAGLLACRDLGDEIEKLYAGNKDAAALCVIAWKEFVSLAQTWYRFAPKGEAETYAAKIQKIDPTYVMPKKAGCISFGKK